MNQPLPPQPGEKLRIWHSKKPLIIGIILISLLILGILISEYAMRRQTEQPANSDIVALDPSQLEQNPTALLDDQVQQPTPPAQQLEESPTPSPQPSTTSTSKTVTLASGSSTTYNKVTITPVKVLNDSRCPIGVQCVWEGEVIIEVEIGPDLYNLKRDETITVSNTSVTFIDLAPEKRTDQNIDPADYRYTFTLK